MKDPRLKDFVSVQVKPKPQKRIRKNGYYHQNLAIRLQSAAPRK